MDMQEIYNVVVSDEVIRTILESGGRLVNGRQGIIGVRKIIFIYVVHVEVEGGDY